MKPTQNNRPQRSWRAALTPEEAREIALLEWQIGVIDTLRKQIAMRRGHLQARASQRVLRVPLEKRLPRPAAPPPAKAAA